MSTASPARPGRLQLAARGLRPIDWVAAALVGVGSFVVAYVVAVISLLLTTAFVIAGSGSSSSGTVGGSGGSGSGVVGGAGSGLPSISDLITAVTVVFGAPAQLVVLGDLGRLSIHGSVEIVATVSGSIHLGFVPVLIAAAQLIALVLGVRLFRSRRLDLAQSALVSVVTGVALALVTVLVGLVLAIRLPSSTGVDLSGITAVNAVAVIVALVVGSSAALLARPAFLARLHPLASRVLGVVRTAAVHLGLLLVVVAVIVAVYAAIARPSGASALPLVLGNVAVLVVALGFLGGASLSDSASSLATTLSGSGAASTSSPGTLTVFSASSVWIWLAVVLVVVTAFAAGLALAVRRNGRVRSTSDWVVTVVVYALAGVLLQLLGTVVFAVQISGVGGAGSAGVTPWTIAVLAAWGAAIEAVARFAAWRVVPLAPTGVLRFTRRLVGHDVVPASRSPFEEPAETAPVAAPSAGTAAAGDPAAGLASPSQDDDAFATARPMSPRTRTIVVRSLVAAAVVLVLVVGGSITAGVLRSTVYGPGHAAEAYLDALGKGDAKAAGDLSKVKGAGSGMLTNRVLGSAGDRISDVSIGKASVSGDLASVAVSYRQAGKSHDETLRLTRTGTSWLVHDTWAVSSSLAGRITVTTDDTLGDAAVTVDGQKVGTTSDGTLDLSAYPGTYSLKIAGSKYFEATTKKVTVSPDSALGTDVDFTATATPQLETDAEKLITDLIATCAKSTSGTLDQSCPFYGAGSDVTKASYRVTQQPSLKVELGYSGDVRVTGTGGKVDMKYTEDFGGTSYDGEYEQSMYVYESLKIVDGKLVLDEE